MEWISRYIYRTLQYEGKLGAHNLARRAQHYRQSCMWDDETLALFYCLAM